MHENKSGCFFLNTVYICPYSEKGREEWVQVFRREWEWEYNSKWEKKWELSDGMGARIAFPLTFSQGRRHL